MGDEKEDEKDSWQCHRCDTSNTSARSRCTSCQGWKWKSGSQCSNDVALDSCKAPLPKVILNDQDFFDQHNSLCEVCGKTGELLCCETCNLVFHTSCTLPKLHKEPPDDWSCSYCCADGVRGGKNNGKERLEVAKACREMEKTKMKLKEAREKALDSGTKDKEQSVKVDREFAKRVAQDSARRSMRERSAPELFVARPSKSGVGVRDGDEEFLEAQRDNLIVSAKRGGNVNAENQFKCDEEDEDSWQCHRCDTSNASDRSRCSSCMGWKGGRQGWRYQIDEGQDAQCVSKPKRQKISTKDDTKPSSSIRPQANANVSSMTDSTHDAGQRCSVKVDGEFAKRVAQDSARRSMRERSAPELFVARPSKSGVGVRDGDEEFLESQTNFKAVAAATDKRSGNARQKRKDESDVEGEDSWQCHRCETSNAPARSRCSSCMGWKGGRLCWLYEKVNDNSEDDAEENEDSWQCHRCDASNALTRSRCSSCMGWRGGRQGWRYEEEDESSDDEEEEDEEDSWQCHRCDTSNASTRSRCSSCMCWKGSRMELREEKEDESSEDEEGNEEDYWECHRCDTLNATARSRCSSCMGWKGGRQGWRYEKEDKSSEEEEEDESCGEESTYVFEDYSEFKRQEWSIKEDKELMKRVRLHGAGNWKTILDNSLILQERYSNAPSGELMHLALYGLS